jgi:hypothetical protein
MYAKCQILESQMERLLTENAHIRDAQAKNLMKDFDVSNYLKWRGSFKQPATAVTDEPTDSKLSLHRDNMRLKDELTEVRIELFSLK